MCEYIWQSTVQMLKPLKNNLGTCTHVGCIILVNGLMKHSHAMQLTCLKHVKHVQGFSQYSQQLEYFHCSKENPSTL